MAPYGSQTQLLDMLRLDGVHFDMSYYVLGENSEADLIDGSLCLLSSVILDELSEDWPCDLYDGTSHSLRGQQSCQGMAFTSNPDPKQSDFDCGYTLTIDTDKAEIAHTDRTVSARLSYPAPIYATCGDLTTHHGHKVKERQKSWSERQFLIVALGGCRCEACCRQDTHFILAFK